MKPQTTFTETNMFLRFFWTSYRDPIGTVAPWVPISHESTSKTIGAATVAAGTYGSVATAAASDTGARCGGAIPRPEKHTSRKQLALFHAIQTILEAILVMSWCFNV